MFLTTTVAPKAFASIALYDGHRMGYGNRIHGPAMIEQETTAIFVSASFDCVVDGYGSFALFRKGREDLVKSGLHAAEQSDSKEKKEALA